MTDPERMSALDFIISVLREHEKNLDSLIGKLENVSSQLLTNKRGISGPKHGVGSGIRILCEDWGEFKELSREARIFSFHFDENELKIAALHNNNMIIYEYRERISAPTGYLNSGVPVDFQARLDPDKIRGFLLRELNALDKKIIRGEIRFSS